MRKNEIRIVADKILFDEGGIVVADIREDVLETTRARFEESLMSSSTKEALDEEFEEQKQDIHDIAWEEGHTEGYAEGYDDGKREGDQ